jgi:hypothetical protein
MKGKAMVHANSNTSIPTHLLDLGDHLATQLLVLPGQRRLGDRLLLLGVVVDAAPGERQAITLSLPQPCTRKIWAALKTQVEALHNAWVWFLTTAKRTCIARRHRCPSGLAWSGHACPKTHPAAAHTTPVTKQTRQALLVTLSQLHELITNSSC